MPSIVQMFNAPPFVKPEAVILQRKNTDSGSFEPLHDGTVNIVCVKDSPEMRQMMVDIADDRVLQAPDNAHYDFVIVHDAFVVGNRSPVVTTLERDDRIIRTTKNNQILKVVYDYTVDNYVQLLWAIYLPANEARPTRIL